MNGIYYYLIAFIAIWLVCLIFKDKLNKYGVELNFPMIMFKTTRLEGIIEKIAKISPKFWRWFMNIGIVISFLAMIFAAYTLIISLNTITTMPSVSLLLPGVEVPGSPIFIPFVSGIIALTLGLIVHEFSHGIYAKIAKIKIKSVGLFLLAILPGAFVEPDDEKMNELTILPKMRIFAAGSVANMSLAIIAILSLIVISTVIIPANFHENGILVSDVIVDSPADGYLKTGMVINSINGYTIHDSKTYLNFMYSIKPNQTLNISTNQGDFTIITSNNPTNIDNGFIGITVSQNMMVKDSIKAIWGKDIPWVWYCLADIAQWVFIINISIGLFNLLPIRGLDGGHLLRLLLEYKLPKSIVNPVMNLFSAIFIAIILFSLIFGLFGGII
ncbi:MAG: site-2 protease family protein [Methanobrevibacter sp.]|nr:site-2 protease family protein [Candidatus Methanoflexus mossambicus]